jgi:hypothetical protein
MNSQIVKHCLESFEYAGTLPAWLSRRVRASFLEAIKTCFGKSPSAGILGSLAYRIDAVYLLGYMLVISAAGAIVSFRYGSRYPKTASETR